MTKNKADFTNNPDEEEMALKRYIKKGNQLKWAWLIGIPVIVICISYGDPSQWLLAIFTAAYIYLTTANYFKC